MTGASHSQRTPTAVAKAIGRVVARALRSAVNHLERASLPSEPDQPESQERQYPRPTFIGLFKDDHDLSVRAKYIARGRV